MKAEINAYGVLTIKPESGVELYALRKWSEQYKPQEQGESVLKLDMHNGDWQKNEP